MEEQSNLNPTQTKSNKEAVVQPGTNVKLSVDSVVPLQSARDVLLFRE